MASARETIDTRVEAARELLQAMQARDDPGFEAVRRVQAAAVLALIQNNPQALSMEDKACLTLTVSQVPWPPADSAPLMAALCPPSAMRSTRAKMQDFTAIVDCFSAKEWQVLKSAEATRLQKMQLLVQRTVCLGGRNLSELSHRRLAALLLVVSEPQQTLTNLTDEAKHGAFMGLNG